MKNYTNNSVEIPEDILTMLPWAAIGKLEKDDQLLFEAALQSYPSLKEKLNVEQQMIGLVSADNSILDKSVIAPTEERLKAVFNIIDSEALETKTTSHTESEASSSVFEKMKNAFDSLIPNLGLKPQYARFASVSVLAISVAVLASFVTPKKLETSEFIPASADIRPIGNEESQTNVANSVILVGFKGTSVELRDNVALKGKEMKIESPADKDGFFQISFQNSMTEKEVQSTINALLTQEGLIWFAGEAF